MLGELSKLDSGAAELEVRKAIGITMNVYKNARINGKQGAALKCSSPSSTTTRFGAS